MLVRLQSQQMLDQLHGDEPLETSTTGAVDGDKDSSDSEDDPCESMQTQNDDVDRRTSGGTFETRLRLLALEEKAKVEAATVSQYDEPDNDENDENDITDDEDEDDYSSTHTSEIQNHTGDFNAVAKQTVVSVVVVVVANFERGNPSLTPRPATFRPLSPPTEFVGRREDPAIHEPGR